MKNTMKYAMLGALVASASMANAQNEAKAEPCAPISTEVKKSVTQSPEKVLEIVAKMVAANEACAGDVVKAAIQSSKANAELVGQIVETAATAAPKQISKIVAAATAVAPDASKQIAAVANKVNAELGTAQARPVHPLDFPEGDPNGNPGPGGPNHPLVGPPTGAPAGAGVSGPAGIPSEANSITNTPPGASR
ncbi:hypothetical protein [Rubritalea tangerina]|uniref:Uncharacterized protein n=1 Tax=Rubritalea tangerina TaxID=430798 RepID=A0ABW4ZCD1_9BACT